MAGGSTGGVGPGGSVPSSPVTSNNPPSPPAKGEYGGYGVSPTTGERVTPKPSQGDKGTAGKSIHDRALLKLPDSKEEAISGGHEPTDEEIDQLLHKIQDKQRQEGHVDTPARKSGKPAPSKASPFTGDKPTPNPVPSSVHPTPPSSRPNPEEVDPATGQPLAKPAVTVSGAPGPSELAKKELDEGSVPAIPEKKSFLQKHGKELAVTLTGGGVVLGGAVLGVFFPPAGLLIYSCGIMMLSMGLSKMLFALEDMPDNLPKSKPDDPKPAPDKKEEPSQQSDADKGKFAAVKKNVLDALKGAGVEPPIDDDGNIDREKLKALQDKEKARQKQLRETILGEPGGAKALAQIEKHAEEGSSPSEIIKQHVAAACAGDESVDREKLMAALNPILKVAENEAILAGPMSDQEREAKVRAALAEFERKLPTMDQKILEKMHDSTTAALGIPCAASTKLLLTTIADMLSKEIKNRAGSSVVVPPPPSGSSGGTSEVPKPKIATGVRPTISDTLGGAGLSDKLKDSKVLLRVFNLELNKAFSEVASANRLVPEDKEKLIELAKSVEDVHRKKAGASALNKDIRFTEQQFLNELREIAGDRLKPLIDAVELQRRGLIR
ncbi:hypothetical protein EOPP23_03985 [Endozoicomonas sp. OPT23]|uniref:hypothetical protein n=1 Tax=Endozoicomonas sp. OPT23 TaxID=2072845 RepID=UPI00129B688A|nr:hypothetical protein [Endozoicomonas sp. OPT23]MRI32155.1 hypothetical protein [Endozoicomonas sp. OPT23]